jgi:hypothetical protein
MLMARPQHFLSYGINRDFGAMKVMGSRVPAANTAEFATLEKHHGA